MKELEDEPRSVEARTYFISSSSLPRKKEIPIPIAPGQSLVSAGQS
jgi:hypothetical protein